MSKNIPGMVKWIGRESIVPETLAVYACRYYELYHFSDSCFDTISGDL